MSWHTFSRWTGHTYRFPDFRLDVYYGSHHALTGLGFDNYTFTEKLSGIKGTEALDQYGSLFNTNFMLTLPNGYKVGSVAGIDNLNQAEAWRNNQPNLLLHQRMVYTKPEDYAQEESELRGQLGIAEACGASARRRERCSRLFKTVCPYFCLLSDFDMRYKEKALVASPLAIR